MKVECGTAEFGAPMFTYRRTRRKRGLQEPH